MTPQAYALKEYEAIGEEKLVSGSDDFTLILWMPEKDKKPISKNNQLQIYKNYL